MVAVKELDRIVGETAELIASATDAENLQKFIHQQIRSAIDQALALSREEAAKICDAQAQLLADEHLHMEPETGAAVWDADSYEGAAIAFCDAAERIRALVHSTGVPSEQSASSKVDQ